MLCRSQCLRRFTSTWRTSTPPPLHSWYTYIHIHVHVLHVCRSLSVRLEIYMCSCAKHFSYKFRLSTTCLLYTCMMYGCTYNYTHVVHAKSILYMSAFSPSFSCSYLLSLPHSLSLSLPLSPSLSPSLPSLPLSAQSPSGATTGSSVRTPTVIASAPVPTTSTEEEEQTKCEHAILYMYIHVCSNLALLSIYMYIL